MKQLTTSPAFNPTARTLDFSSVSGFLPDRLLGVVDATAGQILFNPAAAGFCGTWNGNVLTLQCDTTGLSASDRILAFFDDGQSPALESGGNLAAAVAKLAAIQAALGYQLVGAVNFATAQANIGATAVQIVAARAGPAGAGRIAATIYNNGSAPIYVGGAGVTTADGLPLVAGASITLNCVAAIYGVAASGSQNVGIVETF
jgi:hypothetical protein